MRTAIACVIAAWSIGFGERLSPDENALLLRERVTLSCVVLDSANNPIQRAEVHYLDYWDRHVAKTDGQGRFRIRTRAPAVVIRKPGYDGTFVRVAAADGLRIILQRSTRTLSPCGAQRCVRFGSTIDVFCLLAPPTMFVGWARPGIDSVTREFIVKSQDGIASMFQGQGMWSNGFPTARDVWRSIEYRETAYRFSAKLIAGFVTDAKGRAASGKFWRYVGTGGESFGYQDVDADGATQFDTVLDHVCMPLAVP